MNGGGNIWKYRLFRYCILEQLMCIFVWLWFGFFGRGEKYWFTV